MRALLTALAAFSLFAACASFDDAEPGTAAPDAGGDATSVGDATNDGASDGPAFSCVPDPSGPVDAGPESNKCGPNGEEFDLANSQDHCGFCGHRCGSKNTCKKGLCTPEQVLTADLWITVSRASFTDTQLFVASGTGDCKNGRVLSVPFAGGPPSPAFSLANAEGCIDQIGVLGGNLFYLHRFVGIHRTSTASPAPDDTPIVPTSYLTEFHLAATALFVRVGDGAIQRFDLDGKNAGVMHDDAALQFRALSGDETSGWWLTAPRDAEGGVSSTDHALWTRTRDGANTTKRIGGLVDISAFALDETWVYLASAQGEITRMPKQAPGDPELVTRIEVPGAGMRAFAIAGDYVYVAMSPVTAIGNSDFDLYRAKKCGGRARKIGSAYGLGRSLVPAGGQLYYPGISELGRFELP